MENNSVVTSGNKPAVFVSVLLGLIGAGLSAADLFVEGSRFFLDISAFAVCILFIYYAAVGYRTPHGNLLRFSLGLYAVLLGVTYAILPDSAAPVWVRGFFVFCAIAISFVSGRLNKFRQVVTILAVIGAASLAVALIGIPSAAAEHYPPTAILQSFVPAVTCFAALTAYTARFSRHKEAGEDAEQAQ